MDISELHKILAEGTREELDTYCKKHKLAIKDGKIVPEDKNYVKEQIAFWDKRQLVKKINLNSLTV